jgi:hypothetical protein
MHDKKSAVDPVRFLSDEIRKLASTRAAEIAAGIDVWQVCSVMVLFCRRAAARRTLRIFVDR